MATIVAAAPRFKKRALPARRRPLFNPTGAKTPLANGQQPGPRLPPGKPLSVLRGSGCGAGRGIAPAATQRLVQRHLVLPLRQLRLGQRRIRCPAKLTAACRGGVAPAADR